MADRPIIFSAPMVRVLIAGRKKQTRRVRARWAVGDRLWVREAWCAPAGYDDLPPSELPMGCARAFEADGIMMAGVGDAAFRYSMRALGRSRASIHLPRWASRLTLTVTDVRVQRLQDISREDVIAEGIEGLEDVWAGWHQPYARLWDSLHGAGGWDANRWVAALTFTVQHGNIDAKQAATANA